MRSFLSINQLTGTIPASFGSLANIAYLYLSDNELYGTIPSNFGNLTTLTELYVDV
jgi:Leucine-rich repeat (LRR) protein